MAGILPVVRPRSSSIARLGRESFFARLRRDRRGTTIVEYGIMLFLIIVVAAIGFKVLGLSIQKKFGAADQHMSGQGGPGQAAGSGANGPSAGNGARAASGSSDYARDPTTGGDVASSASNLPAVARLALVAVGIIGGALVFFAISKSGKKASGASK
jgi:Flp pilus assembly pilin Flp